MDENDIENVPQPESTPIENPPVMNQDLKDLLESEEKPIIPEPTPAPVAEVKEPPQTDEAQKLLKIFMDVSNMILNNYKDDRAQIEKTIQYLDNMSQLGPKGGRVYVEMLVAALRTKAETNTNVVKVLDAMAKFISAGKGTQIFVQNNNNAATPSDLAKLLDAPRYEDEV